MRGLCLAMKAAGQPTQAEYADARPNTMGRASISRGNASGGERTAMITQIATTAAQAAPKVAARADATAFISPNA